MLNPPIVVAWKIGEIKEYSNTQIKSIQPYIFILRIFQKYVNAFTDKIILLKKSINKELLFILVIYELRRHSQISGKTASLEKNKRIRKCRNLVGYNRSKYTNYVIHLIIFYNWAYLSIC